MIHTLSLTNVGPFADVTLTFPPARLGGAVLDADGVTVGFDPEPRQT